MGATWLITLKELRIQLRRRTVFILGFAAPLGLVFVLNLVFGGLGDPAGSVTFDVAVVDDDGGAAADRFLDVVDDAAATGVLEVVEVDDEADARRAIDDGEVGAAWIVPDGFSEAVESGGGAQITVVGDVDQPQTRSVAETIANGYATRLATSTLAALTAAETGAIGPEEIATVAEEVASAPPLATLTADDASSRRLDATTSLTAGMALFFVFFTAGMPLLSILEEREQGTMARLLVAPVPTAAIQAGKVLASVLLGTVSLVALMVTSTLLMGADFGPPAVALLLAVAAVVAVSGVMSVAGATARTTEQAGNVQAITAVVLGILGGAFVPLPTGDQGLLGTLQTLTPNGWFIDGLAAAAHDGAAAALPAVGVLVAIGLATGALGLALSRQALRR